MLTRLAQEIPNLGWDGRSERLTGGNLNQVWRLRGSGGSVIVKAATPYVASAPHQPLDPSRIWLEAEILQAFGPGGDLRGLVSPSLRPPDLLLRDDPNYAIALEDVGSRKDLGTWLYDGQAATRLMSRLGNFVADLHLGTWHSGELARRFCNLPMRRARHDICYVTVKDCCRRAGLTDADRLGEKARQLGLRWHEDGHCLIMGDLWPRSILVERSSLRLIDWELGDFASPALDVGHFLAHMWMLEQLAPTPLARANTGAARSSFVRAYMGRAAHLLTPDRLLDCSIHAASEILMRSMGQFKTGYLYSGLVPASISVQQAVAFAAALLRGEASLL